jgi:adenosylhomocysteine nucleosidase
VSQPARPAGEGRRRRRREPHEPHTPHEPHGTVTAPDVAVVVLVCATSEWRALETLCPEPARRRSPFGEWFLMPEPPAGLATAVVYGGWGKIAGAAAAQYVIDAFAPELLVNLGTCGGLSGHVARGEVLLADETLVYDIVEQMTDPDEAIAAFTTASDLSWLGPAPHPSPVRRARLVSADGDIVPSQVGALRARFAAVAADWETGAIAWTAARNGVPCLILRAVSDLVDAAGGEVYDDYGEFERRSLEVMDTLLGVLPAWLAAWRRRPPGWVPA